MVKGQGRKLSAKYHVINLFLPQLFNSFLIASNWICLVLRAHGVSIWNAPSPIQIYRGTWLPQTWLADYLLFWVDFDRNPLFRLLYWLFWPYFLFWWEVLVRLICTNVLYLKSIHISITRMWGLKQMKHAKNELLDILLSWSQWT